MMFSGLRRRLAGVFEIMREEPYEKFRRLRREKLLAALALPLPTCQDEVGAEGYFNPWYDILTNIHGGYASESDDLMIEVMEAVRDGKTHDLIKEKGFIIEFMLYVLSGNELTDYGTSPRGAWPDQRDLWQQLIDKWKCYRDIAWGEEEPKNG